MYLGNIDRGTVGSQIAVYAPAWLSSQRSILYVDLWAGLGEFHAGIDGSAADVGGVVHAALA